MTAALLDVNSLIALVDADHVHHERMQRWFLRHAGTGWATCPLTENGMVRVISQSAYLSGQWSPAEVVQILAQLKNAYSASFEFWPDSMSLTEDSLFVAELLAGPRQVADVYLLGLAERHGSRVISFDGTLPWQAIRGGSAKLMERPV